jgi:acyl-CoA reductase-like NAD-dependent aldehyde dehydrogenase
MNDSALSREHRERRVLAVIEAARRLADARDPLGRDARRALPAATGLSEASIELSLSRYLETSVTPADLAKLVTRAGSAPRVHVVLSANVFTAVVRAVALAVAAAPAVVVRPSSREAVLAPLLLRALVEQGSDVRFELSENLAPAPGDHVHVYGRSETIATIEARCSPGVTVRGHGPGFGVVYVSGDALDERTTGDLGSVAERVSWDIVAFDQRGCLSPRVAFVEGPPAAAERFASSLADALERREKEVPRGALTDTERRERALYRQTVQAIGPCHDGTTSVVGVDLDPRAMLIPPTGRHVHVVRIADPGDMTRLLAPHRTAITCIGVSEPSSCVRSIAALAPGARILPLGDMQRPPLDGPVDQRGML